MDLARELNAAVRTALEAGKQIAQTPSQISFKENPSDLVTEIDVSIERFIKHELDAFGYAFMGEEGQRHQLSKEPTWVVDPIDGTTNFVHSFPFVCVSIGLCIGFKAVLGVVYNPVLKQLYYATEGNGAYLVEGDLPAMNVPGPTSFVNGAGRRLCPDKQLPQKLNQVLLATEYGASKETQHLTPKLDSISRCIQEIRGIRSVGTAAMSMCLLAQGSVDVYYESGTHIWDICAGCVIVQESGGKVVNFDLGQVDLLAREVLCMRGGTGSGHVLQEFTRLIKRIVYERD